MCAYAHMHTGTQIQNRQLRAMNMDAKHYVNLLLKGAVQMQIILYFSKVLSTVMFVSLF